MKENGVLSEKQQAALERMESKDTKIGHLRSEIKNIRRKEEDGLELSSGQVMHIQNNEKKIEELEAVLETMAEHLGELIIKSKRQRGEAEDEEESKGEGDMFDSEGNMILGQGKRKKRRQRREEEEEEEMSDEDDFFDRTGTVKRKQRKNRGVKEVETAASLATKREKIATSIQAMRREIASLAAADAETQGRDNDDDIDGLLRREIAEQRVKRSNQLKKEIKQLETEDTRLARLEEYTKPALPGMKATKGPAAVSALAAAALAAKRTAATVATIATKPTETGEGVTSEVAERARLLAAQAAITFNPEIKKATPAASAPATATPTTTTQETGTQETGEGKVEEKRKVSKTAHFGVGSAALEDVRKRMAEDNARAEAAKSEPVTVLHVEPPQATDVDVEEDEEMRDAPSRPPRAVDTPGVETEADVALGGSSWIDTNRSGLQRNPEKRPSKKSRVTSEVEMPDGALLVTGPGIVDTQGLGGETKRSVEEMVADLERDKEAAASWRPPEGQTGDGRTKLNDLYGY